MSTRTLLKDRRHYFRVILKTDPENIIAKKVVNEIDFILDCLKTYINDKK